MDAKPQSLTEQWAKTLDHEKLAPIVDTQRRQVTAQLLENQANQGKNLSENINSTTGVDQWQPIMISMVRRIAPRLIAYDVCGVQPLTMPTGLIFCLKARYGSGSGNENDVSKTEAMGVNEVDAGYSGAGTANSGNTFGATFVRSTGQVTATAETGAWNPMGVTIEKTSVTAVTRQLRADYSMELAQDMQSVHGLNADAELINILSNEIVAELNREVLGKIYSSAQVGAQFATTAGTVDLSVDAGGRWQAERFKGLMFAIERDANAISIATRRGKGNILIVSPDVASSLAFAGQLDFAPAIDSQVQLDVDPSGATYAGRMGRFKVFVDPYATGDGYCVGYKGNDAYDAGLFYCPYVPLQLARATDPSNFTNAVGFKTRYGIVANPFTTLNNNSNIYYRKSIVANLV